MGRVAVGLRVTTDLVPRRTPEDCGHAGVSLLYRLSAFSDTTPFIRGGRCNLVSSRRQCRLVPQGFSVRRGHRGVPSRRVRRRRRQGRVHLGHVQPHLRQDGQWRHRRHRVRPFPAVGRGSRPLGGAWRARIPLLGVLAAYPANGQRPGQPRGPRLLPPGRGRSSRQGHRSCPHALPLGSAAAPSGRGRVAATRHREPLRRVRRDRCPGAGRDGRQVDHAQRAVVLRLAGLRIRSPRSRDPRHWEGSRGDPSSSTGARRSGTGNSLGRPSGRGGHLAEPDADTPRYGP